VPFSTVPLMLLLLLLLVLQLANHALAFNHLLARQRV